jgi:hypothetical protein
VQSYHAGALERQSRAARSLEFSKMPITFRVLRVFKWYRQRKGGQWVRRKFKQDVWGRKANRTWLWKEHGGDIWAGHDEIKWPFGSSLYDYENWSV